MGWTLTTNNYDTLDEFFDHEFGDIFDGRGYTTNNKREYYRKFKTGLCAIILIDHKMNRGYNIGYKNMDETMHPYFYNCPKKLLNSLADTDNEDANNWRRICQEGIANKERVKSLKEGDTIRFLKPFTFVIDGIEIKEDTYIVQKNKVLYSKSYGFKARIPHWKQKDWTKLILLKLVH